MIDRKRGAWLSGALMTVAPALTAIIAITLTVVSIGSAAWNAGRSRTGGRSNASGAARLPPSHAPAPRVFQTGALLVGSGAFLLSVPVAIAHASLAALPMGVQAAAMLAIMLLARAWWRTGMVDRSAVANGIAVGLSVLASASLVDAAGWIPPVVAEALGWSSFTGRATLWFGHPNILATAAVLPTLAAVTWGRRAARLASGTAAIALVTATGSRTVLAVLILLGVGTVIQRIFRQPKTLRVSSRLIGVAAAASIVMVLLTTFTTVFDRFDPRLVVAPERATANLLYASEDLRAGSWTRLGVAVRKVGPVATLRGDSVWAIEKTGTAWWSRVQQGVTLAPGATVTLQVDVRQPDPAAVPGLHARLDGPDGPVEVTVRRSEGRWSVVAIRGVELLTWLVSENDDWTSLAVTIANPSRVPASLALGLTPDQRVGTSGSSMWIRRPQAVIGEPVGYQPTRASGIYARTSLGTWSDRAEWTRLGWAGFAERPWFGQGIDTFRGYATMRRSAPETVSVDPERTVAHAHQLWSQTAFERGAVGLVGLLLLLGGFALAGHRGQPTGWWALALVVLLNLTDYTFWTTPVSYALGALIGLAGPGVRAHRAPSVAGPTRGWNS